MTTKNDTSEVTAVDSLARGGLLRLFESVFHLRAKGVVRRTVVALARQTLEFFAGAAVEDLAATKLRALRSPETAKAAVDLVERALWPGGVAQDRAGARAGRRQPRGARRDGRRRGARRAFFRSRGGAGGRGARARLKVRDALLASWSRGPLYNLVGARNCTRAGLDVLGVARSELLCARVGLEAMLAARSTPRFRNPPSRDATRPRIYRVGSFDQTTRAVSRAYVARDKERTRSGQAARDHR